MTFGPFTCCDISQTGAGVKFVTKTVPIAVGTLVLLILSTLPARGQGPCPSPLPYGACGGCIDRPLVTASEFVGRIVDPRGDPIPGNAVCLGLYRDDAKTYVCSVPVDENGSFRLSKLPPGTYRIVAVMSGLWSPRLRVRIKPSRSTTPQRPIVVTMIVPGVYD